MTKATFPTVDELLAVHKGSSRSHDETGATIHGWHGDARMNRNSPRKMIRCEVTSQITGVGGYPALRGVNYMLVYADEVASIRKRLPTPEQDTLLGAAKKSFNTLLERFKRDSGVYEIRDKFRQAEAAESAEKSILDSVEQQFYRLCGMEGLGYPAIVSLDVSDAEVPLPETAETRAVENQTAMATAFAAAMKEGNKELLTVLAQILAKDGKAKNA